jgi:hypothetical protein
VLELKTSRQFEDRGCVVKLESEPGYIRRSLRILWRYDGGERAQGAL